MTSITAERSALNRVGGDLRRREQWGARNSYTSSRTVVEPADHQFVHITVSNPRSYSSNDAHARAIEAIGRARFPNTGISYNRLIMPDGAAYEAQPVGRRGAHTVNNKNRSTCDTPGCPNRGGRIDDSAGNLNYNARAYVVCQNVNDPVSRAQVESMARVMAADILAGFVKRGAPIHGHRCVAWKSCPADPMWAQMGELGRLRDQYVRDGLEEDEVKAEDIAAIADAVWGKMFPSGVPGEEDMRADLIMRWGQYYGHRAEYFSQRADQQTDWMDGDRGLRPGIEAIADRHSAAPANVSGLVNRELGDPDSRAQSRDGLLGYAAMGGMHVHRMMPRIAAIEGRQAAILEAIAELSEGQGLDPDAVMQAAREGAEHGARQQIDEIIDDAEVTLSIPDAGPATDEG